MTPLVHLFAGLLSFARPWPAALAFDAGRYLLAAGLVTVVLALAPSDYVDPRKVRQLRPGRNQRLREFRNSIVTAIVFSFVGVLVYHGATWNIFHVYADARMYGWAYWLASLALIVIAHDAYFYWTHRWMHSRRVFPRIHRTHHLSVSPTAWAAYSFSVSEALAQAAFLPLFLLVVPIHAFVLFVWMAHQVLRNAVGHCGIEIIPRTWLASWWGRWLTTTLHHDMHHGVGGCNYGLYFTWWDRWCGTEHPQYRERLQRLTVSIARVSRARGARDSVKRSATAMLAFAAVAGVPAGRAEDIVGEWATQGYSARVLISPCSTTPDALCGAITWLWEPLDKDGKAQRDLNNPAHELRNRPLIGLLLLEGLRPTASGAWSDGRIYDPAVGRTYNASMRLRSSDILEVKGCLLFACGTQTWRRAQSLCARLQ
jgi:sterol desaturase/sphingolipid hydroxylase (fatty acid hydroxylase superfamily)